MEKYMRDLSKEITFISEIEKKHTIQIKEKSQPLLLSYEDNKYTATFPLFYFPCNDLRKINYDDNIISIPPQGFDLKVKKSFCIKRAGISSAVLGIYMWSSTNFPYKSAAGIFRLLIHKKAVQLNFENYFAHFVENKLERCIIAVDSPYTQYCLNGVSTVIEDKNIIIYKYDDYLVIECINAINFESFNKTSRGVLAAIGFFTGNCPLDCGYFFFSKSPGESFSEVAFDSTFLKTYQSDYSLVSLNKYEYFQDEEPVLSDKGLEFPNADKLEPDLKPITANVFNCFCTKMVKDADFSRIIYSIMEVNNKQTVLSYPLRCSLYSVILEMLSSYFYKLIEKERKYSYFKSEKDKKNFIRSLKEAARKNWPTDKDSSKIADTPIFKKLDNICAPTNNDKLIAPFRYLGISLSDKEEEIIGKRNFLLHGANIFPRKFMDFVKETQYVNCELNYLVNALILKYVGYSGKIKNLSKIYLSYLEAEQIQDCEVYKDI